MSALVDVVRWSRESPDRVAVRTDDRAITHAELAREAGRAAHAFGALGVRPLERVALLLPNGEPFVIAWLGALWLGAVPVSVSAAWAAAEAGEALRDADPRLLVTTPTLLSRLDASGERPDVPVALVRDGENEVESSGGELHDLDALLAVARDAGAPVSLPSGFPAAILYTSGTTGRPKGIVLSHANVAHTARSKVRYCGIRESDTLALVVPLAHCFGQNAILAAALAGGAAVRLHRRLDAERLAGEVARGEVTMLFGAPPLYRRLLETGEPGLARARYALSAAATLDPALAESWAERTGIVLHEGYGLTESSPFACYNHEHHHRLDSIGTPIEGVEVVVADPESGAPMRDGDTGELLIRGPNVMSGYWRHPVESRRALRGGWLHSGDLGWRDEDGYLHVVERLDDMVKVSGFRVYPAEVERALASHPLVREVAAFGVPDERHGAHIEAAVVPTAPTVDEAELLTHAAARLAGYQLPRRIHLVESLPRNAVGKVLRRALRERAVALVTPLA